MASQEQEQLDSRWVSSIGCPASSTVRAAGSIWSWPNSSGASRSGRGSIRRNTASTRATSSTGENGLTTYRPLPAGGRRSDPTPRPRGQEDDRVSASVAPEVAHHLESVDVRQHQVEHDHVVVGVSLPERVVPVRATTVWYPARCRYRETTSAIAGSSSTTSTVARTAGLSRSCRHLTCRKALAALRARLFIVSYPPQPGGRLVRRRERRDRPQSRRADAAITPVTHLRTGVIGLRSVDLDRLLCSNGGATDRRSAVSVLTSPTRHPGPIS